MPPQALSLVAPPCGFFGKAPAVGDFLRLHLSSAVAEAFDRWITDALAALASETPDWEREFAAAPLWRFVANADIAGPAPLAGVIGPGRDRIGRSFPCVAIAVLWDMEPSSAVACTPWFDAAESLIEAAHDETRPLEQLIGDLAALGCPRANDLDVLSLRGRSTEDGVFLDVRSGPDGRAVTMQAVLETTPFAAGTSLWWRHTGVGAKVLLTPGLPARSAFAALFRGDAEVSPERGAV